MEMQNKWAAMNIIISAPVSSARFTHSGKNQKVLTDCVKKEQLIKSLSDNVGPFDFCPKLRRYTQHIKKVFVQILLLHTSKREGVPTIQTPQRKF